MSKFKYRKWLASNEAIVDKDKILFKKWEEERIPTYRCYNIFLSNNFVIDQSAFEDFDEEDFEDWLNYLGYYRGLDDEE